jgi:hypothetical protein
MGLPDNDTVRLLLEDAADDGFLHDLMGNDFLEADTATLWWAGKEFFRDQTVGERVGKNEKTKVIARLQKKGGGAPVREPVVSEEERKAMMAWYFKKQEEEKRLAEDDDDGHSGAKWAVRVCGAAAPCPAHVSPPPHFLPLLPSQDPKALKASLLGTQGIGWRGGGGWLRWRPGACHLRRRRRSSGGLASRLVTTNWSGGGKRSGPSGSR